MYKEIKLLTTEGEKAIPMLANGATAIRYRQVFHTDLMAGIASFANLQEMPDKVDWELPGKLGYIMAAAAKGENMNALSEEGYIKWVENFEGDTLWGAQSEITDIYLVNQKVMSSGKK